MCAYNTAVLSLRCTCGWVCTASVRVKPSVWGPALSLPYSLHIVSLTTSAASRPWVPGDHAWLSHGCWGFELRSKGFTTQPFLQLLPPLFSFVVLQGLEPKTTQGPGRRCVLGPILAHLAWVDFPASALPLTNPVTFQPGRAFSAAVCALRLD